jgi:homoserine acetyltransferase
MGTSMGGMHTWLWRRYPEFMDALMPLACLPTQISGRNRVWRRVVIDAIRDDPEWRGGDRRAAAERPHRAGGPLLRGAIRVAQEEMPTLRRPIRRSTRRWRDR